MDLAASVQAVTEEVVLKLAAAVARETGEKNLCLAGGVALNCVANGKLAEARLVRQPVAAAGRRGCRRGVGAALVAAHLYKGQPRALNGAADGMRVLSRSGVRPGRHRAAVACRRRGVRFGGGRDA